MASSKIRGFVAKAAARVLAATGGRGGDPGVRYSSGGGRNVAGGGNVMPSGSAGVGTSLPSAKGECTLRKVKPLPTMTNEAESVLKTKRFTSKEEQSSSSASSPKAKTKASANPKAKGTDLVTDIVEAGIKDRILGIKSKLKETSPPNVRPSKGTSLPSAKGERTSRKVKPLPTMTKEAESVLKTKRFTSKEEQSSSSASSPKAKTKASANPKAKGTDLATDIVEVAEDGVELGQCIQRIIMKAARSLGEITFAVGIFKNQLAELVQLTKEIMDIVCDGFKEGNVTVNELKHEVVPEAGDGNQSGGPVNSDQNGEPANGNEIAEEKDGSDVIAEAGDGNQSGEPANSDQNGGPANGNEIAEEKDGSDVIAEADDEIVEQLEFSDEMAADQNGESATNNDENEGWWAYLKSFLFNDSS